jgi:hypothetical protein
MQCILYKIDFWKGFSYVLQIDMYLICTPMLAKFYSCKKWVLQKDIPRMEMVHHQDVTVELSTCLLAAQREIETLHIQLWNADATI